MASEIRRIWKWLGTHIFGGLVKIGPSSGTPGYGETIINVPNQTTFYGSQYMTNGATVVSHATGYDGWHNTAFGRRNFEPMTTGHENTAVGAFAGLHVTTGASNTLVGAGAGQELTTQDGNTIVGSDAALITTAANNTVVGNLALVTNTVGVNNTAVGWASLQDHPDGYNNVVLGAAAAIALNAGYQNTIVGTNAGRRRASDNAPAVNIYQSVLIGNETRLAAHPSTNEIVIGNQTDGAGSNTAVIGNASVTAVYLGSAAGLASVTSASQITNGANGQKTTNALATALSPALASGSTYTFTNLIPAGSLVVGVTIRVTTLITGATSISIGDGTDADRWGTGIAVAAGTTTTLANATITTPPIYAAATSVVLTAAGSDFTAGVVRATVHYISLTAPTS